MPITKVSNIDTHPTEIINLDCRKAFVTTLDALCSEFATVMPFRVNFQTIDIGGYSPTNIPPIGIAIIGFNNYIS